MKTFAQFLESNDTPLKQINWILPNLEEEKDEILRTAKTLQIDFKILMQAAKKSSLQTLNINIWNKLENTDSQKTTTLKKAKQLAKEYNRNSERIIKAYKTGQPIPAPIILIRKDYPPYLISGNTRLMIAKALKIQSKALIVKI